MTRADAVRAITAGRSVSLFTDKGKQPVFVFFAPRGQSGALFWCTLASALCCLTCLFSFRCEPGRREQRNDRCIPIEELTDLFTGKQSALLKTAVARDADAECCFTLVGDRGEWNLQEETKEAVHMWMEALQVHSAPRGCDDSVRVLVYRKSWPTLACKSSRSSALPRRRLLAARLLLPLLPLLPRPRLGDSVWCVR